MVHLQGGRAGRIPVLRETPLRAWLLGRSERQCSVPSGIRVQFLHELVAPIRHDLSTSPVRSHSTRKEREVRNARKASHFHASRCLPRHHHSYENAVSGCFHAGGRRPCLHGRFSGRPMHLRWREQLKPRFLFLHDVWTMFRRYTGEKITPTISTA